MALIEIFLNRGLSLYEGRLANFNRIAFEYESKYAEPKKALTEAYRVVNYPSFELNEEEAQIQEEYLANNVELLDIGDIIAVDDVPWVYTPGGMKKL
jgi:hypothetical protein